VGVALESCCSGPSHSPYDAVPVRSRAHPGSLAIAPLIGIQQFVAIQLHSYPSDVLLSNHVECVVGARFLGECRLSLGSLPVLGRGDPGAPPDDFRSFS